MKLLSTFFWSGLIAFLSCFAVGLFYCTSDSDISTACLLFSLPSAALMFLSMAGISAYQGEESKAVHASYCLHCASGLANEIKHWFDHNQPCLMEARTYTDLLVRANETFEAACSQPLSEDGRDRLSRLHGELEPLFAETFTSAQQSLDHLRSHYSAITALAQTVEEMTGLSRAAYAARGTYRTGPTPAGQVLYGDQIEPQQEVVMLSHSLTRAVTETRVALEQLEAALGCARPTFLKYRHFLTENNTAG